MLVSLGAITLCLSDKINNKLAAEFKSKSSVGFGVCAGELDGILIWIHQPTLEEPKKVLVDQQQVFVKESTITD